MDANTAAQILGVAAYTVRGVELDAERGVWLVTVRDMSSHTNTIRELPAERKYATGGVVSGGAPVAIGAPDGGPHPFVAPPRKSGGPVAGSVQVVLEGGEEIVPPPAKPKLPRKPKAKP